MIKGWEPVLGALIGCTSTGSDATGAPTVPCTAVPFSSKMMLPSKTVADPLLVAWTRRCTGRAVVAEDAARSGDDSLIY
jgi:hypothetical protein